MDAGTQLASSLMLQSGNGASCLQSGSSHQSSATLGVSTAIPRDDSKPSQADHGDELGQMPSATSHTHRI